MMSLFRRLLQNSTLVFISAALLKAVNLLAFVLIARRFGAEDGGIFSLCTSYLVLFSSLTWGFDELLTRQVAHNRQTAAGYFKLFVKVRPVFSLGLYAIFLLLTTVILKYPLKLQYPLMVMTLGLFTDGLANTAQSLLGAFEKFTAYFWVSLANGIIRLGGVAVLLVVPMSLTTLCWFWTLGSALSAVILVAAAARTLKSHSQVYASVPIESLKSQIKVIAVFLAIGFLGTLEYQTDVVILSAFQSAAMIGLYNAVVTILFSITLLAQAYRMVLYPVLSRYQKSEPEKLGQICAYSYDLLWTASLPMAIGIAILAPKIIPWVFGKAFEPAVPVTQVIIGSLIFIFLAVPNSRLMLAGEKQNTMFYFNLTSTGLNVVLNFLLIPRYAAMGAAISRLISVAVFFLISFVFVNRQYHINQTGWMPPLAKSLVAGLLMAGGVWLLREQSLVVSISAGIILYLVSLWLLRRSEWLKRGLFIDVVQWR